MKSILCLGPVEVNKLQVETSWLSIKDNLTLWLKMITADPTAIKYACFDNFERYIDFVLESYDVDLEERFCKDDVIATDGSFLPNTGTRCAGAAIVGNTGTMFHFKIHFVLSHQS
jgi:hypothetical protein